MPTLPDTRPAAATARTRTPAAAAKPRRAAPAKTPARPAAKAKAAKTPPASKAAKEAKATKAPKVAKAPKADKPAKPGLVRDSFTMPEHDFRLIGMLKERALGARRPAKKSELLRAGLHVLEGLGAAALVAVLNKLTPLKPGRPKKAA